MRPTIRLALAAALLTLSAHHTRATDEVTDKVDWPRFLSRSDMLWKKMPTKWNEGAFLGNGLLGANVFATDDGHGIRWRIGRTDVVYQGNRIPIGEMVLKTVGKVTGAELQLSLWNAELTGNIHTDRGVIGIQSFTHARDPIQIVELRPDVGEAAASWEWQPGLAVNPRTIF
jgi:alpha-L-fucosidase 2